jgi:hypothetical protein
VYYRTAQGVILTGRLHSLLVVPEQSQEGQVFLDEEVLFGVDWIDGGAEAEAEAEAEAAHASSSYAPVSIPRSGRQEAAPPRGLIQKRARVKASGKGGASKDSDSDRHGDSPSRKSSHSLPSSMEAAMWWSLYRNRRRKSCRGFHRPPSTCPGVKPTVPYSMLPHPPVKMEGEGRGE